MKLTKNQKHFLKTIKDKNVRKYQKQQFKLQNQFDSVIVFSDNIFKPRNKTIGDFLSQHPLNGILFKEEFEKVNGKGFPWHEHNVKEVEERFNELAKKYMPKEDTTKDFCVEITEENKEVLQKVWNEFHKCNNVLNNNYLHSNSNFTSCYSSNNRRRNDVYDSNSPDYNLPLVSTEEFLKLIGREDLIERKFSDTPIGGHTFRGELNENQIERVILWMNTWEQLKDTAIPIRFEEDFRMKK